METETLSNVNWTATETADYFCEKINLPLFKEMLTTFFRSKASDKGNQLLRRPPIAVRLLDGDEHVYTIRPGWNSPSILLYDKDKYIPKISEVVLDNDVHGGRVRVQHFGSFSFDRLYVDAVHQTHGKCAKFRFDETALQLTSWYEGRYFEALENFALTAKDFVAFPWLVFSRCKDHCCICNKNLTDEISRGRGIGPECLRRVSNCFGQPPK